MELRAPTPKRTVLATQLAARSVCTECHRLGPAELAYRQVVVNIDRALRYGELIPKRHRNVIEAALQHGDSRVRAYASDVIARDARVRRELVEGSRDDALIEASRSEPIDLEEISDDIPF